MNPHLRRTLAEPYDHPFRLFVPSRTTPGEKYLVELNSFDANGECQCKDFVCRFKGLLEKGVTPEQAVARGLVSLVNKRTGETKRIWDALRCEHIIEGRAQALDNVINTISDAETKHPSSAPHSA